MRRWIAAAAACSLPIALSGCAALMDNGTGGATASATVSGPITVLAGSYPLAFAAERIGGEHVKVTNLTGSSSGHDYEVSPKDIAALNQAHSVIYSKGYVPGLDDAVKQMGARPSIINVASWADLMADAKAGADEHGEDDHDHANETPEEHAGHAHETKPSPSKTSSKPKPKPSKTTSKPKPSIPPGHDEHDGHDHGPNDGHNHGPSAKPAQPRTNNDTVIIIPSGHTVQDVTPRQLVAPALASGVVAQNASLPAAVIPAGAPAQDDDHKHEHHAGDGHDHGGVDPHFWLDPTRYSTVAYTIAQHFTQLAPQHREVFSANAASFAGELKKLRGEYQSGLKKCTSRTMVTSHTAFGYLAAAYGLTQMGIAGVDPEKEPSPAVMSKISTFAKEKKVKAVYTESAVNPALAETVAKEAGATIAHLEPLESAPSGKTYFDVMRANLAALKKGQGCS